MVINGCRYLFSPWRKRSEQTEDSDKHLCPFWLKWDFRESENLNSLHYLVRALKNEAYCVRWKSKGKLRHKLTHDNSISVDWKAIRVTNSKPSWWWWQRQWWRKRRRMPEALQSLHIPSLPARRPFTLDYHYPIPKVNRNSRKMNTYSWSNYHNERELPLT